MPKTFCKRSRGEKKLLELRILLLLLPITLAAGMGKAAAEEAATEQILHVSLIQLIAQPEKYHGKPVQVSGFLHLEFEGNALYLHKDDYTHFLSRNGIWVDWLDYWEDDDDVAVFEERIKLRREFFEKFLLPNNNRYVTLEGVFNAENTGHFGLWSGGIEQIRRVYDHDF
jgi:hypothetical protein